MGVGCTKVKKTNRVKRKVQILKYGAGQKIWIGCTKVLKTKVLIQKAQILKYGGGLKNHRP